MGKTIVSVTKHLTFDASHYLVNHNWSVAQNIEAFHACSLFKNAEGTILEPHGHTYHIEVTIKGEVDPDTGFLIDFKELKKILKNGIVAKMDHRLLNNIEYFKQTKKSPTVENLLYFVWDEIEDQINSIRPNFAWLESIRIWETPDSFGTLTKEMKS